ncbi:LOW QUALITY PROTEIN: von Willebrand factor D and EGF domain-containing protein-like [Liolophura sinensis]|uniref:LOW QUALITY PROTEIN: von Willebrand factor D and EGF domain-containing protein-like n=1 Tax=Liolophura sinensis TaxID=3198878 RepID=UPI00315924D4
MAKLLLAALIIFLCFVPALLQDPCLTNAILAGPETRSSSNVQNTTDLQVSFCDISLTPGWYRLKVDNEDADLATSPPPPGACNTFYPIWINDELPITLNQEALVTACIVSTEDMPCAIELQAKVINCGTYRVYHLLPPTLCASAYCFDLIAPCPAGTSSETGSEPGCSDSFPNVAIKPVVTPLLGMSTEDENFEDLRFNCSTAVFDPGYFYDVVWRINGDEVIRITKQKGSDLPESGQLLETVWKHEYKLGMNVQCSVRVRSSENGVPSPEHHSDEFFAGLRCLSLAEKKVPCVLAFKDFSNEEINGVCKRTIPGECGFDVSSHDWNAIHELKVTAEYDGMFGGRLAEIFLKAINPVLGGPLNVWADVTPPVVNVNIHDLNVNFATSMCYAVSDPHFKSFDRRFFDVQLPGEFVLYRHKTLPLEVRGFFQPCGGTSPARCVCGGAVRSGKQLFVYSFCRDNVAYQTTRVRVFGCNQKQMRVTSLHNGREFQIDLPNGARVIIGSRIYIYPSPADVGQVMGLCGNFNGDKEDEYIGPNGIRHSNDCDFFLFNRGNLCVVNNYGSTWRIDDQIESFYNYPDLNLGTNPVGRCSCTSPVPGLPTQNVDCTNVPPPQCDSLDPEVTSQYCTQLSEPSSGQRRRQTDLDESLNFDDIKHILPTYPDAEFARSVLKLVGSCGEINLDSCQNNFVGGRARIVISKWSSRSQYGHY